MEITELGPDDLADDALMREFYDLHRRSASLGREGRPHWTWEEFIGAVRSPDLGEREQHFVVRDGGTLVAAATLASFLLDNTDKDWLQVDVDPPHRRRGIGRAVVRRLEEIARADGRALMMFESKLPYEDRESHGYSRFAEACGYQLSNYEVVRHLPLPLPDSQVQSWIDEAAPRRPDYTVEVFVDGVPDDLVDGLCLLLGQLGVDAPTGAVDFEEEVIDRQRYAEMVARSKAMGRARYEALALTADRQVAAQSTLSIPRSGQTEVFQWGTFVHREHRGHRLGLAVKAANLQAAQAFRDDLTLITTQNAETNGYMVSINEHLGFRPVEVSAEFVKHL